MMPSAAGFGLKQIAQGLIALVLLIGLVWLTFYVLLLLFIVSICVAGYVLVRRWLIAKEFITPRSSDAQSSDAVIDAEYRDVTGDKKHE